MVVLLLLWLNLNWDLKRESGAFLELGLHCNFAFHFLQDHFGDCQAQTHAAFVDILRLGQLAEELEQLLNLRLLYADARVYHLGYQCVVLEREVQSYRPLERKFGCIADQVEHNLLVTLLVRIDLSRNGIVHIQAKCKFLGDELEMDDVDDLVDDIPDVEPVEVGLEYISFDPRHIQRVLNNRLQVQRCIQYQLYIAFSLFISD